MSAALLLVIVGALLVSAFVTTAEAAVFQISSSRLRTLRDEGFAGHEALLELRQHAHRVGFGTRLVTGVLTLGSLGTGVAGHAFTLGAGPVWLDVGIGTVLVIVVVDLIPHLLAAKNPVRIALASAGMLRSLVRVTSVVSAPFERLEEAWVSDGEEERSAEERELREIQEMGRRAGILGDAENALVERAFRLDEVTAWDVMVPRVEIFAWPEERRVGELRSELADVPFSRIPVYRGSIDNITGIVYAREIYASLADGRKDVRLTELAHEPFFVPGSMSCAELLREFQVRRIHMGIVADEFGGVDGLVTLEDVLEELVGEIHDETDVADEEWTLVAEDVIEADGGVDVREINEALGVELPKTEHRSLNGYILEELGRVPSPGEVVERDGVRIEILDATETQVRRARVARRATAEQPEE